MGSRVEWGIDPSKPEPLASTGTRDVYDGPLPPLGVTFHTKLTYAQLKKTSAGNNMVTMVFTIDDDRDDRKAYNGYGMWHNLNVTDQGKPYILPLLDALGVSWEDFMSSTKTESKDIPSNLTHFAGLRIESNPRVGVRGKKNEYDGKVSVIPQVFFALGGKKASGSSDNPDSNLF